MSRAPPGARASSLRLSCGRWRRRNRHGFADQLVFPIFLYLLLLRLLLLRCAPAFRSWQNAEQRVRAMATVRAGSRGWLGRRQDEPREPTARSSRTVLTRIPDLHFRPTRIPPQSSPAAAPPRPSLAGLSALAVRRKSVKDLRGDAAPVTANGESGGKKNHANRRILPSILQL